MVCSINRSLARSQTRWNMNSTCPKCQSKAYKRNGYTRHGKQNHRCLDCGRQFSREIDPEAYAELEGYIVEHQPGWQESKSSLLP